MGADGHNGNRTSTTSDIHTTTSQKQHQGPNPMCEKTATWQTAIRPETNDQRGHNKGRAGSPRRKTNQGDTGQHQFFYNVDLLPQQDRSITTDPVQVHNKQTWAFKENFICPQQHIHSPPQAGDEIEHERFLTDKEYSKDNSGADHKNN